MSAFTFDATKVAPASDRAAVPPDTYSVIMVGSDIKVGKTPQDRLMSINLKVIEGPLSGSIIFQSLNIMHANPVAQQIAQERFSSYCHAIGVLQLTDTAQLHGRPFKIKTSIRVDETTKKEYTEVDSFLKADGMAISAIGTQAPAAAPPAWAQPNAQPPAATPPPAVAPPPAAASPSAAEKMYYIAKGGSVLTPQPVPASQVLAIYGGELQNIQVLENGTNNWVAGATLTPAQAPTQSPPPGAGLPPWIQPPP